MVAQVTVDWPTCDQDGCTGIRLDAGLGCIAHAGDDEREAALGQISQGGKIDARGVTISRALLDEVLASAPCDQDGRRILTQASFQGATFQGSASFEEAIFTDGVTFTGAVFEGSASFADAIFGGSAEFGWVTFRGGAGFSGAAFQDRAVFAATVFQDRAIFIKATCKGEAEFYGAKFQGAEFLSATFEDDAQFIGASFQGGVIFSQTSFGAGAGFGGTRFQAVAWFDRVTFHGAAKFGPDFGSAVFQGDAWFNLATFRHRALFSGVTFRGAAVFGGATFRGTAVFDGAAFEQASQFGPVLAHRGLDLDGVLFAQAVQIEASTPGLCCCRGRFPGGVQFRLRWARVVLDDTDLSAPSLLTGIPRLAVAELTAKEQRIARAWERLHAGEISEQPRLLSLRRANVAGLGLADINPADCRFAGAHNLDMLRLEPDVAFDLSPARAGWERREVIAEESAWRAGRARPGRWAPPWWPDWAGSGKAAALTAGQIAGLYRALRKGREDAKDEPGAADFYYGEMEMRRHARGYAGRRAEGARGRVDRTVLTAYWLVSGYGLRSWRSLAWLTAVTLLFAFAFHRWGFTRPPRPATYWTSLLYAFRSTISLTDDDVGLTAWGQLLQALLRLTGPVLLGLALLALRGRIKR